MKTKKPTNRVTKKTQQKVATAKVASGRELGLKEQVKAGLLTAKQAMTALSKKGSDAIKSDTYQWLSRRAAKEGAQKGTVKAGVEEASK